MLFHVTITGASKKLKLSDPTQQVHSSWLGARHSSLPWVKPRVAHLTNESGVLISVDASLRWDDWLPTQRMNSMYWFLSMRFTPPVQSRMTLGCRNVEWVKNLVFYPRVALDCPTMYVEFSDLSGCKLTSTFPDLFTDICKKTQVGSSGCQESLSR